MEDTDGMTKRWILTGGIAGIAAVIIYFVSVSGILPVSNRVLYPVFWLFGPLMVVTSMGLRAYFHRFGPSVVLEVAAMFWILAGAIVCVMACMQAVAREHFHLLELSRLPEGFSEAAKMGFKGANAIQAGADLAWDIFIFTAFGLYGVVMLRRDLKWRILAALGMLIGALGLAFNFAVWPANPGTAGLVDVGPFAGAWGLIVSIVLLMEVRKID